MFHRLRRDLYQTLKTVVYGAGWPARDHFEPGYTILCPVPADMPFLLRFALEGLRQLEMPNCKEILVLSDGSASDQALRDIATSQGDSRVRFVPLRPVDRLLVNLPRSDGSANYRHFTTMLRGVAATKTETIYLHDADAFWLETGGIESQYREFLDRGLYTLGVTSRIDPMFKEQGLEIPGTWELMFSNAWVRSRPPAQIESGTYRCPDGQWRSFDNLLYGQYMDYASGRVGLMSTPPAFVHFYGTITQYRYWQRASQSHEDELFCLLLLSVLADAVPNGRRNLTLPRPHELARGLSDASAPVTYLAQSAAKRYASFQRNIAALCSGPVFSRDVRQRIQEMVAPFDDHFSAVPLRSS